MDKKTRLLSLWFLSPLLLTACCITDFLFAGNLKEGSTDSRQPGTSTSPRPVNTGSTTGPVNNTSGQNPAATAPSSALPRPGTSANVLIPLPRFSVSPVPIGIPVPVPMIIPVGIPLPVPDVRPTSVSPAASTVTPLPPSGATAPVTRLFEIQAVTVVRQADLRYRFEVKGQGFGLFEAYAFLQARLGPFSITLIENGRYRSEDSITELAIGDQELRFVWQPAQGGPTASDRFQLSFQPFGVEQVFQTAEMEMILTSE